MARALAPRRRITLGCTAFFLAGVLSLVPGGGAIPAAAQVSGGPNVRALDGQGRTSANPPSGAGQQPPPPSTPPTHRPAAPPRRGELEVGSTLFVGIDGLEPRRMYELRLAVGGGPAPSAREAVSFARVAADGQGRIPSVALWYNTGIVGSHEPANPSAWRYETFDEAERALADKKLVLSVHPLAGEGRNGQGWSPAGAAVRSYEATIARRRHPLLYACDEAGRWRNAAPAGEADLYVAGARFQPGEEVELLVVPHQRLWHVNDVLRDVTGERGTSAPKRVRADESGNFRVKVWDRAEQHRGVYDQVVRRGVHPPTAVPQVGENDLVFHPGEPGFLFYQTSAPGSQTYDLVGRPTERPPYFQATHAFTAGEPVWGCVQPTVIPAGQRAARYAAIATVEHRDAPAWESLQKSATPLADVSGGVEIVPVKPGTLAAAEVPIWNAPLPEGRYDVVVDFSVDPAMIGSESAGNRYDPRTSLLSGADQPGFVVAADPDALGSQPIGRAEYARDAFFRGDALGDRGYEKSVALRGIVCYPAANAGADTPVAPGKHPIFVIEHGNHRTGVGSYKGYMHLLEILAGHGIIAVSIDSDDLVTGWGQPAVIEERGDLILKHLELWSHLNDPAAFPSYPDFFEGRFRGAVDLSRVAVSGHSRGGEASVAAYVRNRNPAFTIRAVSSIAPVDFVGYQLAGVPYFVILPAADGDVVDLDGLRIYDRARLGSGPDAEKSGIYVYGANHNYFNRVWGRDGPGQDGDDSWQISGTDDHPVPGERDDYIDKDDQLRVGEAYVAAFTRLHLNGETLYRDMLRGRLTFPSTAGFKIYHFYEEPPRGRLEDGTGGRAVPAAAAKVPVVLDRPHATRAVRVRWTTSDGQLTYPLPGGAPGLSRSNTLSFRAAQTHSPVNPVAWGQDFEVELLAGGKPCATWVSRFDPIPVPYRRWAMARATHRVVPQYYEVMTTVRIPLQAFLLNRPDLDLSRVEAMRFRFAGPSQGEIDVSDVEFSR